MDGAAPEALDDALLEVTAAWSLAMSCRLAGRCVMLDVARRSCSARPSDSIARGVELISRFSQALGLLCGHACLDRRPTRRRNSLFGQRHSRGSRAGHPRRRPFSEESAASRRVLVGRRERSQNRDHEPDHAGAADRRREGRVAADPQGARLSPRVRAQRPQQHLRDRPSNDGLRRRQPETTSCGSPAMSSGWNEPRSNRPIRSTGPARGPIPTPSERGPATTRIRSTPSSACTPRARSACPSSPRSGRWRGLLGEVPEARRRLGLHSRLNATRPPA